MTKAKPLPRRERSPVKPLDSLRLADLAYFYVGRFAVTEGRLKQYLARKVHEKGWADKKQVSETIDEIIENLVALGAVNDLVVAQSTILNARQKGLAGHRVRLALASKLVKSEHIVELLCPSDETDLDAEALEAARRFAQRKRLGPWRTGPLTPTSVRRETAAMIRGGHSHGIARIVLREARDEECSAG
jgi:regulatory protein